MSVIVETELGRLEGSLERPTSSERRVRVFRGIPFADPPVGAGRFSAPRPAAPWSGVRQAFRFGSAPVQPTSGPFSTIVPGAVADVDEDCLSLNVWVPEGEVSDLPVMVWFYGGAFLNGGTAIETYDGARLCAEQELVVVSANYRLGAFGFLFPGGLSGRASDAVANAGLLDQLAALGWVQRNIAAFGGDPTKVTVFGESAGAGSILHLLTSPSSKGLFQRAALQSPGVDHTLDAELASVSTDALLRELGLDASPDPVAALRQVPAQRLLEAQERAVPGLIPLVSAMPFHPVLDGELLADKPSVAIAAGAGDDVGLLLTWTADEMRLFPDQRADAIGHGGLVERMRSFLTRRLGAEPPAGRAEQLVDHYSSAPTAGGNTGADIWAEVQTDGVMRLPAWRVAGIRANRGATTYCAQFAWRSRGGPWARGAFHAIDQPFVFGTVDRCGWREFLGAGEEADTLSEEMRSAWAAFARTGRPAGPRTGTWQAHVHPGRTTTVLDADPRSIDDLLGPVDGLWEGLWSPGGKPPTLP